MTTISDKATTVAENLSTKIDKTVAFDPAIILVITQIIESVIQAIQACQKPPASIIEFAKNPGLLGRFRLRRIIRDSIDDDEMHAYISTQLIQSLLAVGSQVSEDEAAKMFGGT